MELNGNDEKEPSVLSRDASLEEKVNEKPPSSPSGETSLEEKVHNEPATVEKRQVLLIHWSNFRL